LTDAKEYVPGAIARGEYAAALDGLVQLKPAIDGFFNGVMVNAEDQALRANRLSLLEEVDRLFAAFADFSHIAVPGS
jgi:glycyl-tRNA synthetase beta chain